MLAEHISREQRIADMEIHGWRPIRDTNHAKARYRGIYSESLRLGFALRLAVRPAVVTIVPQDLEGDDYPFINSRGLERRVEFCEWGDIPDAALDAIDARLAET